MGEWLDEPTRAWLYRVAVAVAGLLTILGVLSDEVAQQVLLIAAAVLGTGGAGMAARHTRTKRQRQREANR